MSHGIESFGLRYLTSGIGSPETVINQNLLVNYVLHKGIEDRDLTAPPASPVDGAAYIPAATATGLWAGHEDHIAYWFDESGVWKFLVPEEGISIYVNDENLRIQYSGSSNGWVEVAGTGTVTSVDTAGTVSGLTLTGGPITGAGTITLGGTLAVAVGDISGLGAGVATFLATPSSANLISAVTDETGTGSLVFSTSPTLVTPLLGTPTSGTLTNCTGLPVSSGISGLAANVATFLATPSSANLISAVTDETGTGALVFATSPTLVTPALGTPASGNLSSCTADGTNAVGFLHIPQNSQSAAYTTVLADAGKHILHPSADTTARTFTIDSNANVAYPIGTAITFINEDSAGVVTIAITSDTMRLAGAGTTGSRTLAANGVATAVKITSTSWIISGTNLT